MFVHANAQVVQATHAATLAWSDVGRYRASDSGHGKLGRTTAAGR